MTPPACETCKGTRRTTPIAGRPLKDAIGGGDGVLVRCSDCDASAPRYLTREKQGK